MLARRFYANTQSFSFNLCSTNYGGVIDHAPVQHVREALNERAYNSYLQMCERLGIPPLSFSGWSQVSDKMRQSAARKSDAGAFEAFHGYTPSEVARRPEMEEHLTAQARGLRQAHLGSGMRRVLPCPQAE